jgi:hypothetical protein
MSQQVFAKPNLLFYPLRCTASTFPSGRGILPSDLRKAWNPKDLKQEWEEWSKLNPSSPWAAEIYPDFPWMEAICGCSIQATKQGYRIHPVHPPSLLAHIETVVTTLPRNPWTETYFALKDTVSQWANESFPIALPAFTGPAHLLVSLNGKTGLSKLMESDPRTGERILDLLFQLYQAIYARILYEAKPGSSGYIAGGSFLPSSQSLIVLKDPAWMEFQRLLPMETRFYNRIATGLSSKVFLATPAQTLRWLEPCNRCIPTEGIIVEKNEASLPWEDLVPLFKMIQASGHTLVIAGPPEMEDWEFARRDLEPENLMVLFYVTSQQEMQFWSEHLLGTDRRSLRPSSVLDRNKF